MDDRNRLEGRKATTTAARARRRTLLLAACGALLASGAASAVLAQATVREAPRIEAPVRAQTRVIAPRVLAAPTLTQAETVAPDLVHKMDIPALLTFTVEAEEWGDNPALGFTVQDMSGWGSDWSGNKQIFWNPQPPGYAFKWDFSVTAGKMLRINLTAAPDYANLDIRLGCYRQVSANYYQLDSQHNLFFEGYATSVRRRFVSYPLTVDPKCRDAAMYRLLFVAKQSEGRTFAGIDSIVVTR
jgi:hypothetical protein